MNKTFSIFNGLKERARRIARINGTEFVRPSDRHPAERVPFAELCDPPLPAAGVDTEPEP